MSTRILYHDFQNTLTPTQKYVLTGPALAKGRRFVKAAKSISPLLSAACIFLCSTCISMAMMILLLLAKLG